MPKHGHLYHLRGEGRAGASMRQYADAWTAMALIRGKNVHWIDGACRFNPTKILQCVPSSFPEPEQLLHQMFVYCMQSHVFTYLEVLLFGLLS